MPAVKVSVQAVALQMAAAKLHGQANYGKYDELTVSISPPDATIALLSRSKATCSAFRRSSDAELGEPDRGRPGIGSVGTVATAGRW